VKLVVRFIKLDLLIVANVKKITNKIYKLNIVSNVAKIMTVKIIIVVVDIL
jgi:hypothetical protein